MKNQISRRRIERLAGTSRRDVLIALGAVAAGVTVRGLAQAAGSEGRIPTLLIDNARIWSGEATLAGSSAIAIAGMEILAVGPSAAVRRLATKATRVVDARGAFLMPGFNDSHLHLTNLAADRANVNLLGARKIADVLELIRARVATTPPGEWVRGRAQWHEALLAEARMPTARELDAVSPNNPVFIPRGGHVATANSRALALFGIKRETPDPPGGIIVRDAQGDPMGMLIESARSNVNKFMPTSGKDAFQAALREQIADLSALGITSLTNPATQPLHAEALEALHRSSPLNIRVHWTVGRPTMDDLRALRARLPPGAGDEILRFSGLGEVPIDGGIEGAALRDPYEIVPGEQTDPQYRGIVLPFAADPDAAVASYLEAIEAGYNVMTHVTGDRGLDVALDLLTKVQARKSFRGLRWTLHGCFLIDPAQLARIRELDLTITAQAQTYLLGAQQVRWWGRARADRSIPMRAFLDAGIRVGGGSDAPAGIASPMESMGWMVNRLCLGNLQLDRQWSITPEEALRAYTRGSAHTQFMEHRVGTLKPGMLADLVVLSENPLTVRPQDLNRIRAELTVMNGRVVFDRNGIAG